MNVGGVIEFWSPRAGAHVARARTATACARHPSRLAGVRCWNGTAWLSLSLAGESSRGPTALRRWGERHVGHTPSQLLLTRSQCGDLGAESTSSTSAPLPSKKGGGLTILEPRELMWDTRFRERGTIQPGAEICAEFAVIARRAIREGIARACGCSSTRVCKRRERVASLFRDRRARPMHQAIVGTPANEWLLVS